MTYMPLCARRLAARHDKCLRIFISAAISRVERYLGDAITDDRASPCCDTIWLTYRLRVKHISNTGYQHRRVKYSELRPPSRAIIRESSCATRLARAIYDAATFTRFTRRAQRI